MFAIHDQQGLKLRGTLEVIKKHKRPAPIRLNRHKSFWDEHSTQGTLIALAESPSGPKRYKKAEGLYRQALKLRINEPIIHAHQIMSPSVYTVSPVDTLADAWSWLNVNEIQQMPVIKQGVGIVSMLSRQQIERLMFEENLTPEKLARKTVGSIMAEDVITTEPVSSVRRIARVMSDYKQHAMPVVENGDKLLGIITRGDVLRALSEEPKLNLWT